MSSPNADFPATRAMGVKQCAIPPNPITGTTQAITAALYNIYSRCTNAAAKTLTLSVVDDALIPIGFECEFRNVGAGAATFVPEAPVAISGNGGSGIAQHGTARLKKVAAQSYDLMIIPVGA